MSARHTVSALVVTYNHEDEIAECLDATFAQATDALDVEVVVVDCGSTDGTLAALEAYADRATIAPLGRNAGHAVGVNEAFARASGDLLLILNPDVVMDPGCVTALAAHLDATPSCACAAALLRDLDGGVQRFARRDPGLRDVAWNFTELGKRLDARRGGREQRRRTYEDEWSRGITVPLAVDCPAAACVLVPRAALAPRPMDPALPLFFDDAELWRRLRRQGRTLDVVPAAGAAHGYGTSVQRVDQARLRAEWVASVRTYLRGELGPAGRGALWLLFALDAATATALHVLGRGDAGTPGHVRGTLGGLGLPGGAEPWMADVRRSAR